MNKKLPVIAIVGPTATGKTALSIEVAKRINGEIINGDAMQFYRGLDIGTAKIKPEEMNGIVHHLIDTKDPTDTYSVAEFQQEVRALIADINARGKMPILVGGTGLYVKAALYDYEFGQETNTERETYDDLTNEAVHAKLMEIDPEAAAEIHPNNRRRVIRALNIFEATGRTKTEALREQDQQLIYNACLIGLNDIREDLYSRINHRVDNMLDAGLLTEVENLIAAGVSWGAQSMSGIGYKEFRGYFEKTASLEEAVELVKRNSRRLAKRQIAWFNNQMDVNWFQVDVNDFNETVKQVMAQIKEWRG